MPSRFGALEVTTESVIFVRHRGEGARFRLELGLVGLALLQSSSAESSGTSLMMPEHDFMDDGDGKWPGAEADDLRRA